MSATGERAAARRVRSSEEREPATAPRCRIRSVGLRELAVAWLLLGLLGVAAFGPHVRDGGFYLDDWANAAGSLYPPGGGGFGGALSYFADLTMYRPVLVLYVPLTFEAFGTHMGWHLAWAAALAVAAAGILYAILRSAGLPRVDAWLLSALVLVFPWFDSIRMWSTAAQVALAVALYLAGVWLALVAFRRRSPSLHAGSLLLYAASLLTYEIALALVAATGLLYVGLVGWRAARGRWLCDGILVLASAIWVVTQTTRETGGLAAHLDHLRQIVTAGGTLLGRTAVSVGPQRTSPALVVLGVAALVAVVAWRRDRRRGRSASPMLRWLLLGAAGVVVAACGWAPFVPADPYYTPSVYGITNRVNALAGVGLVMVVYAAIGVVGTLVRATSGSARAGRVVTVVLACGLGATYLHVIDRHSEIWERAFEAQMAGLAQMKTLNPDLPDGSVLFVSGYPAYQTLGVPIFSTAWDVNGAIKVQYRNGRLAAYPVISGTRLVCTAAGVRLVGFATGEVEVAYGQARLFDVPSGRRAAPRSRAECERTAPTFVPGPFYLDLSY